MCLFNETISWCQEIVGTSSHFTKLYQNHHGIKNSRHYRTNEKLGEKNLWLLWNFGTSSHFTKTISKPLWNVIKENSKKVKKKNWLISWNLEILRWKLINFAWSFDYVVQKKLPALQIAFVFWGKQHYKQVV